MNGLLLLCQRTVALGLGPVVYALIIDELEVLEFTQPVQASLLIMFGVCIPATLVRRRSPALPRPPCTHQPNPFCAHQACLLRAAWRYEEDLEWSRSVGGFLDK